MWCSTCDCSIATCSLYRQARCLRVPRAHASCSALQVLLRCGHCSMHRLASCGHLGRGRPLLQQNPGSGFMQSSLPAQVPIDLHFTFEAFNSSTAQACESAG